MTSKHLVIFDGDDTLWKMQELYDRVKQEFEILLESIGIKEEGIISQLDDVDARRVGLRGFTFQRFIESMLLTYARLSAKHGLEYDENIENQIRQITKTLHQTPTLYEDTIFSLDLLKNKVQKILLSAGHYATQKRKINRLNLNQYFDSIHIVSSKDEKCFQEIIMATNTYPNDVWIIGNSPRSDIIPALNSGLNAILLSRGTWKYDEQYLYKSSGSYKDKSHIANSLSEAANIILQKLDFV